MKRLSALAAACVLALAGCGGHQAAKTATRTATTTVTTTPSPAPATTSRCVPGNSFMGCSLPAPGFATPRFAAPAGRKFVDVSDWQPSVSWSSVKASGIFAVVVKAGEGLNADPTYAAHVAGARAAGLQVMAYWFERPVGCGAEAAAIDRTVPHGIRVVFDLEVPGVAGYASCERSAVQAHTGLLPAVYTSPGTWPGGSAGGLPLWQAEYGPVLNPFFRPVVAWQFSETQSIAGIAGLSDESVDLGLFPAPGPVDVGGVQHYERYDAAQRTFRNSAGNVVARASERGTAREWTTAGCVNPVRREVCKSSRYHLALLQGRLLALHASGRKWGYGSPTSIGARNQEIVHRLDARKPIRSWAAGL